MDAAALAGLAKDVQQRLLALPLHADPSWAPRLAAPLQALPLRAEAAHRDAMARFTRCCGPLPPLPAWQDGATAWALLGREALLARLAALALLGRPGVLRCCVLRPARDALQRALGPAFAPLARASGGSPAVIAPTAHLPPQAWAWVGYRELLRAGIWRHRSLRRLVRLALPPSREMAPPPRAVPPSLWPLAARLAALERLFDEGAAC